MAIKGGSHANHKREKMREHKTKRKTQKQRRKSRFRKGEKKRLAIV